MTGRPKLVEAPASEELCFGPRGELRESFAKSGRVHLDRWVQFLVLHRTSEPENSIGRQVAVNSPAYLIWSPEDEAEAESVLELVLGELHGRLGPVLLVEMVDSTAEQQREDSSTLPSLRIDIGASPGAAAQAAASAVAKSVANIRIDSHHGEAVVTKLQSAGNAAERASARISLTVPDIHRVPDGPIYPQLMHELVGALIDSILCAASAFMEEASGNGPTHFRSLGRSAILSAALKADKKLDSIARSFDFLLSISPINTAQARDSFFEAGEREAPDFEYRPLTVDPDIVKRDLYAIDLSILEDLLLERLLCEKRREIDMQLTMLATRNTAGFRPASMLLYGGVADDLLQSAHTIVEQVTRKPNAAEIYDARHVAAAASALIARYRSIDERFEAKVEVRDDVSGLLVSGGKLMISSRSAIARNRLDPLLAHEVSVHLLTYFNGATQGLTIFRTGLAHYEGIQEGLGVFAEWAVGGLTPARLRLLAGRVIAVDAMIGGAGFVEVYRMLRDDFDFPRNSAFDIVARVFRSGGLAKDAIYLKGFLEIVERVATGTSLDAFWLGKIAPEHVDAIDELLRRGLLHPPVFAPEFLERDDSKKRIDRLRAGESFLLSME